MMSKRVIALYVALGILCAGAHAAVSKQAADIAYKKDLVYATVDGIDLKYDIARPVEGNGPFPLIMCIHAGGWQLGDKKSYHDVIRELAARGYVAVTVNYRLASRAPWPAQIDDVRLAVRFFRSHAAELGMDPTRLGAIGDDSGGHLSLMLGLLGAENERGVPLEQSTRIQAVANYFGPTDLREWRVNSGWVEAKVRIGFMKSSEQVIEDFLGTRDRTAPIYLEASPISHVTPEAPPVLTVVGTADPLLSLDQPKAFHEVLRKAGVAEDLMIVEGADHDRKTVNADGKADARMYEFFDTYVKGSRPGK
jgi:acetyl esterase/lipase